MKTITSNQNEIVKHWSKLQTKKERTKTGQYLIEGWHLINEALASVDLVDLMVVEEADLAQVDLTKVQNTYLISKEVAKHISSTPSPQGIFATVAIDDQRKQLPADLAGQWLFLDGVQDPGNIGTIIRTADAAGISGVVLGTGSADMYNPKVVRSMQGSHFHVKVYEGDLSEWVTKLTALDIPVYGTELNPQAVSYNQLPAMPNFALIMGNEGNGVSKELLLQTTKNLYIPIRGRAESLNVAIATGILLFKLIGD